MVIATERVVAPTLGSVRGREPISLFPLEFSSDVATDPKACGGRFFVGFVEAKRRSKTIQTPPTSDQPSRPEAVRLGLSVPSKDDNCIIKFRGQEKETIAVYGGNI